MLDAGCRISGISQSGSGVPWGPKDPIQTVVATPVYLGTHDGMGSDRPGAHSSGLLVFLLLYGEHSLLNIGREAAALLV